MARSKPALIGVGRDMIVKALPEALPEALSILVCPKRSCTACRLPVRRLPWSSEGDAS